MLNTNMKHIRQQFIDYFRKNNYVYLKPSDVWNPDDPSLLFVNAGMNQLKKYFAGEKYTEDNNRLVNSQICIRAGGKHNDLDDVGKDSYHLTSFEMLGNWYLSRNVNDKATYEIKKTAILLALDFLTSVCGLSINNIYVTYFEGINEISEDTETKKIWMEFITENRIIKGSFKDNFWQMGDNGPCGPCTEIHYDLLSRNNVKDLVNQNDPSVIEIWNIVFMSFNKNSNNEFIKMDSINIDTGMGLERLAMIMQNKQSIYECDFFKKLMNYFQIICNADFYTDTYGNSKNDTYRIFVDHFRTTCICLFQGINFGANGREYILRKIFRRMLTNIYIHFEFKKIMNHMIIPCLITEILSHHLYTIHDSSKISNLLIEEEILYYNSLVTSESKYNKYLKKYNDSRLAKKFLHEDLGIPHEFIDAMIIKKNI